MHRCCLAAQVFFSLLATAAAPTRVELDAAAPTAAFESRAERDARGMIATNSPEALAAVAENFDTLAKVLDAQSAEGTKKLDRAAFGDLIASSGAAIEADVCVAALPSNPAAAADACPASCIQASLRVANRPPAAAWIPSSRGWTTWSPSSPSG